MVGHTAVVHGIADVVGGGGAGEIAFKTDVEKELAGSIALFGKNAHDGLDLQTEELKGVGGEGEVAEALFDILQMETARGLEKKGIGISSEAAAGGSTSLMALTLASNQP